MTTQNDVPKKRRKQDQESDLAAFGKALRELREGTGRSQERLALEAGVDRASTSAVERGQRNMTVINVLKLCRGMKVRPSAVFRRWEELTGWPDD